MSKIINTLRNLKKGKEQVSENVSQKEEKEFQPQVDPSIIPIDVQQWLTKCTSNVNVNSSWSLNSDGLIDVVGGFKASHMDIYTELPVPFGRITNMFSVSRSKISSLKNFPHTVESILVIDDSAIVSCSGIHKHVKAIDGSIWLSNKNTHILGVLMIEYLSDLYVDGDLELTSILLKYLGPNPDVIACQEELIEAGYTKQART